MTTNTSLRRMSPLPRVKLRVSRRNGMGGNPKNRVKRSHRIEPAIEPEHVFVEVRLQMFWLDTPMMSTLKPGLQVAENKVDHGQVSLSFFRIAPKRQHVMIVSCLSHPLIFRRRQFATSDTYLDPEILVLRVLRHRILRRDHRW